MKRLRLIVTGQAERRALHLSLKRLFEEHLEVMEPLFVEGFTSNRLRPLPASPAPARRLAARMAEALVAEVSVGRKKDGKADLVVALDDLELANDDQPQVVVAELKAAIQEHL